MNAARNLSVLVVEDHDFQRRTLVRMLLSLGARHVHEASDGNQALLLLRNTAIDVMICDLSMPNMDGMELIRHMAEIQSTASCVISSAQGRAVQESVERMAREYGVRTLGVIEKPATLAQLNALIERHHVRVATLASGSPVFTLEEILHALQQKQFEPFIQPKVDLQSGRIVGAEALACWRHPEHGPISPYAFIAPLERAGMIDELTFQMLEMAARACREWRERGLNSTVSVNLSASSLSDATLADRVLHALGPTGLEPTRLILEVTETSLMTEAGVALENLARLRMHGIGLSVDDYGTGFSNLKQLTRVPFTELKIDRGFVTRCAENPSSHAVAESCVAMARRLGIKSVAEGVETQADWDALKALGCDMAQGYFISRPLERQAFMAFCAARAA
jgi:EAL domain-containing protein (putative c-di-GMP-specific phosphodiesterase class I)/ActR/RegA family two-component response regulator